MRSQFDNTMCNPSKTASSSCSDPPPTPLLNELPDVRVQSADPSKSATHKVATKRADIPHEQACLLVSVNSGLPDDPTADGINMPCCGNKLYLIWGNCLQSAQKRDCVAAFRSAGIKNFILRPIFPEPDLRRLRRSCPWCSHSVGHPNSLAEEILGFFAWAFLAN
jgi:hypothetical protein